MVQHTQKVKTATLRLVLCRWVTFTLITWIRKWGPITHLDTVAGCSPRVHLVHHHWYCIGSCWGVSLRGSTTRNAFYVLPRSLL